MSNTGGFGGGSGGGGPPATPPWLDKGISLTLGAAKEPKKTLELAHMPDWVRGALVKAWEQLVEIEKKGAAASANPDDVAETLIGLYIRIILEFQDRYPSLKIKKNTWFVSFILWWTKASYYEYSIRSFERHGYISLDLMRLALHMGKAYAIERLDPTFTPRGMNFDLVAANRFLYFLIDFTTAIYARRGRS